MSKTTFKNIGIFPITINSGVLSSSVPSTVTYNPNDLFIAESLEDSVVKLLTLGVIAPANITSQGIDGTVVTYTPTTSSNWPSVPTTLEAALDSLASLRKAITAQGILIGAGLATLNGSGTLAVANALIAATSRIVLTVQDTGAAPTGRIYNSARSNGVSFTILSSAGVADAGVIVYYQIWGPSPG